MSTAAATWYLRFEVGYSLDLIEIVFDRAFGFECHHSASRHGKPYNQEPHQHGNGQMVAFLAESRAIVDAAYAVALANGGTSEGPPRLRPEYHEHYYGAYFGDPDGNKLCVVCHSPPD